jgi:hypothetical protein
MPGLCMCAACLGGEQAGLAADCNRGIARTQTHEDVVMLNSDARAHRGWLEALRREAVEVIEDHTVTAADSRILRHVHDAESAARRCHVARVQPVASSARSSAPGRADRTSQVLRRRAPTARRRGRAYEPAWFDHRYRERHADLNS